MNSRPFAPTAVVVLCLLQVASTPTQALDPPYLSEMPSVDKVMQAMRTADPGDTALRQAGAFYQLVEIVKTLSGRREFRGFTPDESRVIGAYLTAQFNVEQAADKSFPPPAGSRKFSDQIPYRFGRWDGRFGVEGIQTFKMFLSPALKAQFDAIVAGDNARREARQQEYKNQPTAAAQPASAAKPGSQAEAKKCIESGRSQRVCLSESMNAGLYELSGINLQIPNPPGLRMTGDYATASGFRLIFLPNKVAMICRGVGSPHLYAVENTGTQVVVKIPHGSTSVVYSLRADGKLVGSGGPIRVTGQVPAGTHTEQTNGMTTQTTSRTRELSPGEQRYYPNATKNGQLWSIKEDATEYTYGPTGTQTVTTYATKTTDCTLGLLSPVGATPLPPDLESPFGILTSIFSGAAVLMQGGSVQAATKEMLAVDNAPPPGLRMTGTYSGQDGFSIKFHPESATLSCGEAAHALPYSVERNASQTVVKIQDNTNPLTLQLKPDGSLFGEGTIQVNGRVIVGTTEDPKNLFVYAPKLAKCAVGNLVAGGATTTVSTSAPVATPTAAAPGAATTTPAIASLSIASAFASQPGTNPLAGKTIIILKESFESILARAGWGQQGSTRSALTAWAHACEVKDPSCQKGIAEVRPYFISSAQLDNSGAYLFQNARAGTYYLLVQTTYNGIHLVWNLRMDLTAGANTITLDQRNATPVQ